MGLTFTKLIKSQEVIIVYHAVIFAPNVGFGGGLVLLNAMLGNWSATTPLVAFLDDRAKDRIHLPSHAIVYWCTPSFVSRLRAEWKLKKVATENDTVFCFHNLPPVFKIRSKVKCYVQNPNLVGLVPTAYLVGWVRTRIAIERFIARRFASHVDQYIVQTPSMARALKKWYQDEVRGRPVPNITVLPFIDDTAMPARLQSATDASPAKWDFLYVSDGAAHKNHARLFEAWTLLAEEGFYPSLALTLHADRDLLISEQLRALKSKHNLAITDLGQVPHREILAQYGQAKALFFASYAESFGIPLLEAQAAGLPIVAAELDYVRDLCAPVETFDPFSPISMARAVKRFLDLGNDAITPLTPEQFVQKLIAIDASVKEISTGK